MSDASVMARSVVNVERGDALAQALRLAWTSDPSWRIRQRYLPESLTTRVSCWNPSLGVSLHCNDVVDFHRPIMVRKVKIKNMAAHERTDALEPRGEVLDEPLERAPGQRRHSDVELVKAGESGREAAE